MPTDLTKHIQSELEEIRKAGLYKEERVLLSPQQAHIKTAGVEVLNFCANNYLGLANHPDLIAEGKAALDQYGYGMASVRFICGTSEIHRTLENRVSEFLQTEDTILYSSCFDANTGLFETLLNEQDAIISDRLNHASIIDGVRLCKATRFRYNHSDMAHLETQLKRAADKRFKLIATDGVFSMDGDVALLAEICDLAKKYGAWVMVDDSHATGFFGPTGRGSIEFRQVMGRVDITQDAQAYQRSARRGDDRDRKTCHEHQRQIDAVRGRERWTVLKQHVDHVGVDHNAGHGAVNRSRHEVGRSRSGVADQANAVRNFRAKYVQQVLRALFEVGVDGIQRDRHATFGERFMQPLNAFPLLPFRVIAGLFRLP